MDDLQAEPFIRTDGTGFLADIPAALAGEDCVDQDGRMWLRSRRARGAHFIEYDGLSKVYLERLAALRRALADDAQP